MTYVRGGGGGGGRGERERIEDPFGCVLLKTAPLKPTEALNDKLVPSNLSLFSFKHNHPRLVGVGVFRSSGRKSHTIFHPALFVRIRQALDEPAFI